MNSLLAQLPFDIPLLSEHVDVMLLEEIVAASNIVQQLDHPAHALFLLRPEDARIPDSVNAWSVSVRCTGHRTSFVSNDVLILVMKVYLPTASDIVYDPWLDRSIITLEKRTLQGWDAFARGVISDYHFTLNWWSRATIQPENKWMGTAVKAMAEKEIEVLADALEAEEKERAMEMKRIRREIDAKRAKTSDATKRPLKLTPNELEVAKCNAERQAKTQLRFVEELWTVLEAISADTFDKKTSRIAACVMCLCKEYPRIRWSTQLCLHQRAYDICDMSAWHVQRELHNQRATVVFEPLQALKNLC